MEFFGHHFDVMTTMLGIMLVAIGFAGWRLHQNPENDFNILDLLMENGRVSKAAVVLMGAFALTSWLMVQLTLAGKMTEGYFGLYSAAWIAPVVVKLITQGSTVSASKTTTTTATATVTK
jgi:hypothetical protein